MMVQYVQYGVRLVYSWDTVVFVLAAARFHACCLGSNALFHGTQYDRHRYSVVQCCWGAVVLLPAAPRKHARYHSGLPGVTWAAIGYSVEVLQLVMGKSRFYKK